MRIKTDGVVYDKAYFLSVIYMYYYTSANAKFLMLMLHAICTWVHILLFFVCVCVCLQLNVDAITILNGQKYKRRLNLFDCSFSQNIPAAERRSLLRRPQDLLFIIYLIPAFAFCVFRGLVRRLKMCKSPKITLNIFLMWSVCVLDCSGLFQPMVSGLRAAVRALPERPFGLS